MALASSTSLTIASGASLSGAGLCPPGYSLCGIVFPSVWTAATMTFQASVDGTTYNNIYNTAGTEYSVAGASASRYIAVDPADFSGSYNIKVRSGTAAAPVNQGQTTIVLLVFKRVV